MRIGPLTRLAAARHSGDDSDGGGGGDDSRVGDEGTRLARSSPTTVTVGDAPVTAVDRPAVPSHQSRCLGSYYIINWDTA